MTWKNNRTIPTREVYIEDLPLKNNMDKLLKDDFSVGRTHAASEANDSSLVTKSNLKSLIGELNHLQLLADKLDQLLERNSDQMIQLHERDGISFVKCRNILRFEAQGAYTKVYMQNSNLLISRHLKFFEAQIESDLFCRVHQSHLINLMYVDKFLNLDGGQIQMNDDSLIPISKTKKTFFFEMMNKYNNDLFQQDGHVVEIKKNEQNENNEKAFRSY
ncbi:MAG: LytTR family DNA-binding domain-containing protein [Reichenbachiella sp.]|uniref:LytR/AlgR family response regulator transcription factor n=1 Tax=Reichenbachiella sp. TaxID=2184521 RepID=UPI003265DA30